MSDALQLFRGFFEIAGLVRVALGIVETRRAFDPDCPGVLQKIARAVAGFVARLTRRNVSVNVGASDILAVSSMEVGRINVQYGFEGSLEERVERLQEIAQQHEDGLDEIAESIGSQTDRLRADIRSLQDSLRESEEKLTRRVSEAATNGLTLETWGVFLFVIGVVLTAWGGVIAWAKCRAMLLSVASNVTPRSAGMSSVSRWTSGPICD